MRVGACSSVGRIRTHNEDSWVVADLTRRSEAAADCVEALVVGERGALLGVFDGMGGAAGGEVASGLAVERIHDELVARPPGDGADDLVHGLLDAMHEADRSIRDAAEVTPRLRGMGTTATVALVQGARLFVGQVGDSRAYVARRGRLVRITRDQSAVAHLFENGLMTEEEAQNQDDAGIILQALGAGPVPLPDVSFVDLRSGDVLLLCSDGLTGMLSDLEIGDVLWRGGSPTALATMLVDLANEAGGTDNVSAVVARFESGLLPPTGRDVLDLSYRPYDVDRDEAGGPRSLADLCAETAAALAPASWLVTTLAVSALVSAVIVAYLTLH